VQKSDAGDDEEHPRRCRVWCATACRQARSASRCLRNQGNFHPQGGHNSRLIWADERKEILALGDCARSRQRPHSSRLLGATRPRLKDGLMSRLIEVDRPHGRINNLGPNQVRTVTTQWKKHDGAGQRDPRRRECQRLPMCTQTASPTTSDAQHADLFVGLRSGTDLPIEPGRDVKATPTGRFANKLLLMSGFRVQERAGEFGYLQKHLVGLMVVQTTAGLDRTGTNGLEEKPSARIAKEEGQRASSTPSSSPRFEGNLTPSCVNGAGIIMSKTRRVGSP